MCYARRGLAHASLKNHAAAISDFQHASSMPAHEDVSMVEVYICMARCRFHLGSRSSALLAVRAALELQRDNLQAKALRKCLLMLEGHIDDYHGARKRNHWRTARAAYESCLDIYEAQDCPSPVEIRCWGIELRVAESDWEGALRAIDLLLQRETKSTEAMIIRALVLFWTGKLPQALEQIITVLKTDPDNETAKTIRSRIKTVARLKEEGDTLYKDGEWKDAIARWDTALEVVYENENEGRGGLLRSILLSSRAAAKLQLKEFEKSLKDVEDALKLNSTLWSAFLTRARIHAAFELYDLACEDFRAVLQHAAASNVKDLDEFRAELEKTETIAARERKKEKDYYTILGISRGCTLSEIRKAYLVQSRKHHPDKGGIAEKFKLIGEAYSVLSDENFRRDYDAKRSGRTAQRQKPYSDDSYSYSDDDDY
ncbi:DnaJ-domain-containing protein [Laetiporus sulphureus 93-53]|uniref:DnaJ-domain-containing protein n=1 Tax=Laetiporus sulphureus 93-53 TaxID=1314785 RepID=A0A165BYW7_9APHY|nr:DnaJ-domain-containing protein [Laetiporus sulphureus 93-53]KZT01900.1 DnaJ-domain-containing protein [Laetiporus sulphureus 93-53]